MKRTPWVVAVVFVAAVAMAATISFTTLHPNYGETEKILAEKETEALARLADALSGFGTNTLRTSGGATGAATNEAFVTIGNSGSLSAERALTGTANQISVTDGGANGAVTLATPQNIDVTATPTFGGLVLPNVTAPAQGANIQVYAAAASGGQSSLYAIPPTGGSGIEILTGWEARTLTESTATTFVRITAANNDRNGGYIDYVIDADDATDYQSLAGRISFAEAKKGAANPIVVFSDSQVGSAVSAGTLTATVDVLSLAGVASFRANAVSSLTQTTLRIRYRSVVIGNASIVPQ